MPTPSIQTLVTDAQQVLNLDSISAVRSVVAVALANANTGTPLNPNLTTQQLWNEFYQVVNKPKSDIESIIANQLMKLLYAPPAPGGVGANGQVIFNDNGVLAGDSGLTFNPATDTLRAGLLIVPGNTQLATVGILYVGSLGSPKLKVDVAGTGETTIASATITGAATAASLTVTGSSIPTNGLYLPTTNTLEFAANSLAQYRIAPLGVFSWYDGAGGTRMTLNSTGLGVGGSPADGRLLTIGSLSSVSATANAINIYSSKATLLINADGATNAAGTTISYSWANGGQGPLIFRNASIANVMTLDASGNVGVGVTPSAIGSTLKAIQVSPSSSTAVIGGYIGSTPLSVIAHNAFFDGTNWKRVYADYSSFYRQSDGTHRWELGGTGLAGATFSPTQAMTLNAAGSLVLGAAAVATTATDGFLYIPGCAGTPTGTPTSQTGRVPLVVDTTNNKLYFYSGGSWVAAN